MGDGYDNGYGGDFKRNPTGDNENNEGPTGPGGLSEVASNYLRSLLAEKIKLNQGSLPLAVSLLDKEVERVKSEGRARPPERYVDLMRDKPIRVVSKVIVPIKEHPKFNFVGKLLGPKGNTMKQLQEETLCKMAVLGRGSMRDRQKEEEYRQSLDPKYSHLSEDLHVEISALGPPAEAHARMAYALAEVKKYLIPDPEGPPMHPRMQPPLMERGGVPMRGPPLLPRGPPMKKPSILDRARGAAMEEYGYEDFGRPEPPVRMGPRATTEYYYSERALERPFAYDDEYYKRPQRDYKSAASRDVGTRRFASRDVPYARPPKH